MTLSGVRPGLPGGHVRMGSRGIRLAGTRPFGLGSGLPLRTGTAGRPPHHEEP